MRVTWWAVMLCAGCVTTTPPKPVEPEKPAEPTEGEQACLEAIARTGERLASDEFAGCERDSDCRGVSALLSGHCDTVANAQVFDAHLEEFRAQTATCDPVVQLVPRCLRLQPVCRGGRCAAEPRSELPDECAELGAALARDAQAANTCQVDAECAVVLPDERPTSVAFVSASLERREQLARACGTVPAVLFLARPQATEAFCVSGRCVTEKANPQFTTVVRSKRSMLPPELDTECIKDQFLAAFTDPRQFRGREWSVDFIANLDTTGRFNQFEFVLPQDLSLEAQRSLAARLSVCRARQPARHRGKPVAIRHHIRIRWISP